MAKCVLSNTALHPRVDHDNLILFKICKHPVYTIFEGREERRDSWKREERYESREGPSTAPKQKSFTKLNATIVNRKIKELKHYH